MNKALKVLSSLLIITLLSEHLLYAQDAIKPLQFDFTAKPKIALELPESVATIEDAYVAPNSTKTLVLFQDAHMNESGQIHLAQALDKTLEQENIKYVFLEAGFGDSSLPQFKKYGTAATRKNAVKSLLQTGEIQGVEYLYLGGQKDFSLWGVEKPELYAKSLETYRVVAKDREKFQDYLKRIETTILTLRQHILNPLLLGFDKKHEDYEKEKITLTQYFSELLTYSKYANVSLESFEHLKKLDTLTKKESEIDFAKANEEQAAAIRSLSEADQQELADLAQNKVSAMTSMTLAHQEEKAFYALLQEKLKSADGRSWIMDRGDVPQSTIHHPQSDFKELSKYFDYLHIASEINLKAVLSEMKELELQVYDHLAMNEAERTFIRCSMNLKSLNKLFTLTMTPEEFEEYRKLSDGFTIDHLTGFLNRQIMDFSKYYERVVFLEPGYNDIVKRSEEFYELTKKRDEYFIEKSLEKMDLEKESKAVLVTGGYHTTNLKNILKAKGISYIVVTPQILHETNLKNYEKVLLKQDLNPTIFGKLTTPALSTMAILHTAASPLAMQAVGARLTSLRETQSERGNLTTSSPKSLIGDRMDSRLSANKASADPSSGGRGNDLGVHTLAAARLADVYFEWTPQYTARLIAYLEEGISQLRDLELLAQSDQTRDVLTKNIAKLENQKERILGADPTTVPQFLNAISDIGDELYRYLRNFNYTTPESNKSIYTLFNHGLIFGTDSWEKAKDVLLTYDYLLNMKIIGAQYSRQGILVKLYLNCLDDNFNLVTKSNFFGPNDTVQYSIIDAEENNVIGSVTLDLDKSLHTARIKKININSDYPKLDPQILSDWFRAFWKLSLGKSLTVENENFAVTFGARMALEGESSTSSPFHLSNQPTQLQAARLAAQKPTLASNLVTRVFNEGIEILTASLIVTKSALTSVISLFRTFTSSLREVRSSAMAEISFLKDSTSAATSLLVYPLLGSLGVVINQNSSTADGFNQVGTENPLAGSRMPEATFSAISPQPSSQPGALVVGARAAADEKLAWVIAAIQMGESSEVLKVFRDESQPLVVRLEAASHLVKLANRDFAAQANRLLYEAFDDTTNSVEARTIAAVAIQEQLNPPDRHASWRYPETVVANESFPLEARMTAAIYVLRHHNPPDRTKAWGLPGRVLKDETAPFSARLRAAVYIYKTSNPPDRPLPVYARQLIAKTYHFGARIGLLRRVLDGTASQDPGARLAESKPQITDDSLQSPVSSLQSSQGARLSRRTLVRSFWDILTDVVKLQKEKQIDPKSFTIEELEQKGLWWSDYDRKSFHVGRMLEVGIEGKWIIWSESKQSYSLSDETFRKIVLEIEAEKKRSEQHRENVDRLMLAIASNLNPTAFTLPELQALGLPIEDISSLIDSLKLNERWIISTGKQTVWPGRGNFKYAIYTLTEKGHAKLRELGARLADLQTGIERIEGERRIISGPLYSISDVMLAVSNHIGSYANPRIFKAFAVPANDEELNDSSQLPWFYLPEFARDRTNLRQYLDSRHQNNPEPLPSYRLEEAHFRHQGLSGKIIFIVPYIDGNVPAEYPVVPRSLAAEAKRPDDKALVESGRPGARMAKTTMQSPTVDRESLTFRRKRKNGIVINDNVSIWVENIDAKGIDISLSTSEKNVRLMSLSDYRRLQANDFRGVRSISRNRWQNLRMPRNDSFVIFLSRKINAQTPYSVISITKLNNDDVWLTIEKPSFIPVHRYEIYGELEEQQRQERLRQLPSLSGTSAVRREQTVVLRKSGLPIHLTERDTLSMAQRAGAVVFELREMADPRFKIYPIPPRGRVLTLPIHDRTERIKIQIVSISKDKSYAVIRFKAVGARLAKKKRQPWEISHPTKKQEPAKKTPGIFIKNWKFITFLALTLSAFVITIRLIPQDIAPSVIRAPETDQKISLSVPGAAPVYIIYSPHEVFMLKQTIDFFDLAIRKAPRMPGTNKPNVIVLKENVNAAAAGVIANQLVPASKIGMEYAFQLAKLYQENPRFKKTFDQAMQTHRNALRLGQVITVDEYIASVQGGKSPAKDKQDLAIDSYSDGLSKYLIESNVTQLVEEEGSSEIDLSSYVESLISDSVFGVFLAGNSELAAKVYRWSIEFKINISEARDRAVGYQILNLRTQDPERVVLMARGVAHYANKDLISIGTEAIQSTIHENAVPEARVKNIRGNTSEDKRNFVVSMVGKAAQISMFQIERDSNKVDLTLEALMDQLQKKLSTLSDQEVSAWSDKFFRRIGINFQSMRHPDKAVIQTLVEQDLLDPSWLNKKFKNGARLAAQEPTLASNLVTRVLREGMAIRTASSRVLTWLSSDVRRSLTSAISSVSESIPSLTFLKSPLSSSIRTATSLLVKSLLGSLGVVISPNFSTANRFDQAPPSAFSLQPSSQLGALVGGATPLDGLGARMADDSSDNILDALFAVLEVVATIFVLLFYPQLLIPFLLPIGLHFILRIGGHIHSKSERKIKDQLKERIGDFMPTGLDFGMYNFGMSPITGSSPIINVHSKNPRNVESNDSRSRVSTSAGLTNNPKEIEPGSNISTIATQQKVQQGFSGQPLDPLLRNYLSAEEFVKNFYLFHRDWVSHFEVPESKRNRFRIEQIARDSKGIVYLRIFGRYVRLGNRENLMSILSTLAKNNGWKIILMPQISKSLVDISVGRRQFFSARIAFDEARSLSHGLYRLGLFDPSLESLAVNPNFLKSLIESATQSPVGGARLGLLRRVLDGTASQDPGARLAESRPQTTDDRLQSPVSSLAGARMAKKDWNEITNNFRALIAATTTVNEAERIYRELAKATHPDWNSDEEDPAKRAFQQLLPLIEGKIEALGYATDIGKDADKGAGLSGQDAEGSLGFGAGAFAYAEDNNNIMGPAMAALSSRTELFSSEDETVLSPLMTVFSHIGLSLTVQELAEILNLNQSQFIKNLKSKLGSQQLVQQPISDSDIWRFRPILEKLYLIRTLQGGEILHVRLNDKQGRTVVLDPISADHPKLRLLTIDAPFLLGFVGSPDSAIIELSLAEILSLSHDFEREPKQTGWEINIGDQLEVDYEGRKVVVTVTQAYFGGYSLVSRRKLHNHIENHLGYAISWGKWDATNALRKGEIRKVNQELPPPDKQIAGARMADLGTSDYELGDRKSLTRNAYSLAPSQSTQSPVSGARLAKSPTADKRLVAIFLDLNPDLFSTTEMATQMRDITYTKPADALLPLINNGFVEEIGQENVSKTKLNGIIHHTFYRITESGRKRVEELLISNGTNWWEAPFLFQITRDNKPKPKLTETEVRQRIEWARPRLRKMKEENRTLNNLSKMLRISKKYLERIHPDLSNVARMVHIEIESLLNQNEISEAIRLFTIHRSELSDEEILKLIQLIKEKYSGPIHIVGKVGGTSIAFEAATADGLLGYRIQVPTNQEGDSEQDVVNRIAKAVLNVADFYGRDRVQSIYFTAPGFFDSNMRLTASEENIPALKRIGFSFAESVSAALGSQIHRQIPVQVVHDGTGAALGEISHYGTLADGSKDLFFVIIGTGVGTRRLIDGKPYFGDERVQGLINEAPHTLVFNGKPEDPDFTYVGLETKGEPWFTRTRLDNGDPNPQYRGQSLEDRTNGAAIVQHALEEMERVKATTTQDELTAIEALKNSAQGKKIDTKLIGQLANQGNSFAKRIVQERARELGVGLAVMIIAYKNIFGVAPPQWVILGSGVAQIGPLYLEAVREGAERRFKKENFGFDVNRIILSSIQDDTARELLGGLPAALEGARLAEFKLNARHMDVLKRFYDYEASGSTSGLAIEEVEPGRDRNLIILKLEKNGYLEKLPLEQYVLTTKGYKVVEDNLQNYGDNNLYRRLDGVYKPSTIYRQSPQKYQERLPRRIERVGDPRTRRNLGGYGARLADLALGVVKAHAADELENPFALTRVNAPERVRAVKTVNGARLISIAPDGTQSLLVEASSNRNRPINPTDSPTAHDIVTRFRQVHLNTDLEMPAHMEARTALAHVFNLEPFAAFTDEDFMEQILNLQAEVLKTQTTRTYKNDVFYLDGSENLSERQRGLLETIKTPFILGKPDAFEGVIVRYVVTDNLNAVPSQDGRSIFMPVQGISAGHGEGWYQVISEAGLVGGFFARHLNADGKINFTEINVNELPSEAFHFHNSVTAMKNLEQYYQLLVGGLSLALMKKLAFKLPIIEASGARLIQAGMMMLRAVGVAA